MERNIKIRVFISNLTQTYAKRERGK